MGGTAGTKGGGSGYIQRGRGRNGIHSADSNGAGLYNVRCAFPGIRHDGCATAAAYYQAEEELQEQLAQLDAELLAGTAEIPQQGLWELKADVQEIQQLLLIVECKEPSEGEGRYQVLWQRLVNTVEWNPGPGVNIWDGGM